MPHADRGYQNSHSLQSTRLPEAEKTTSTNRGGRKNASDTSSVTSTRRYPRRATPSRSTTGDSTTKCRFCNASRTMARRFLVAASTAWCSAAMRFTDDNGILESARPPPPSSEVQLAVIPPRTTLLTSPEIHLVMAKLVTALNRIGSASMSCLARHPTTRGTRFVDPSISQPKNIHRPRVVSCCRLRHHSLDCTSSDDISIHRGWACLESNELVHTVVT